MVESLQNGSWITGWLALLLVLLPVAIAFYNENKTRSKLLDDIKIYNNWSEKGDPAGIEFCRTSINNRIEKLYSVRKAPIINILFLILCISIMIFSCYVLLNGIAQDSTKQFMWVADFLLYLLIALYQVWTIRSKLRYSKTNQQLAASVFRQHFETIKIGIKLNAARRDQNCNDEEEVSHITKELARILEELYEVAEQIDGIDVEYLKDKYDELTNK